jgi:hypothetical protein
MPYQNMRQHERRAVRVRGWIRDHREETVECWVDDMSAGGAKLIFADYQPPETFKLMFSEFAPNYRNCIVRWRTLDSVGVQFIGVSMYSRIAAAEGASTLIL